MRTLLVLLVLATPAFAGDHVEGVYDVKFEEAGSTCSPKPETFSKGKLTISVKNASLIVKIDTLYQMLGAPQKNGAINAKTAKLVGTAIGGLSARYSVIGHVDDGKLELALTAQYIRQDTNKPHCTQAWNITGARTDAK